MLPCNSGAEELIVSNSNTNFQQKQIVKHGIAQYSVNNTSGHTDVTTLGYFWRSFHITVSISMQYRYYNDEIRYGLKINIDLVSLN